jgi:nucleoside-diphosphate-sugar epimerase
MKYFVTGATGFIGGVLVRQLIAQKHDVIALVRSPTAATELSKQGARLHQGDITDRESLRGGMAAVDGVFHVAAWYKLGCRDAREAERVNVEGTRNVLETMRDLKIPRGVYTSTLAVFSDTRGRRVDESYCYNNKHLTEYDRTKWLAHYQVAQPLIRAGLPLIIVQPGVVYGPRDHSLVHDAFVQLLQGRLWFVPSRTAYCWAHVDDVARGHILAMERGVPGESYILSGPAYPLSDVLDLAARLVGVRPPHWHVPSGLLRVAAMLLRPMAAVLPLPARIHPETLRASSGVTYLGDDAKARAKLGYSTRPLEEGLRQTLRFETENIAQVVQA